MPDKDVDPSARGDGTQSFPPEPQIRLPWESIDPNDPAYAAEAVDVVIKKAPKRRKAKTSAGKSATKAGVPVSKVLPTTETGAADRADASPAGAASQDLVYRTLPPRSTEAGIPPVPAEDQLTTLAFLSDELAEAALLLDEESLAEEAEEAPAESPRLDVTSNTPHESPSIDVMELLAAARESLGDSAYSDREVTSQTSPVRQIVLSAAKSAPVVHTEISDPATAPSIPSIENANAPDPTPIPVAVATEDAAPIGFSVPETAKTDMREAPAASETLMLTSELQPETAAHIVPNESLQPTRAGNPPTMEVTHAASTVTPDGSPDEFSVALDAFLTGSAVVAQTPGATTFASIPAPDQTTATIADQWNEPEAIGAPVPADLPTPPPVKNSYGPQQIEKSAEPEIVPLPTAILRKREIIDRTPWAGIGDAETLPVDAESAISQEATTAAITESMAVQPDVITSGVLAEETPLPTPTVARPPVSARGPKLAPAQSWADFIESLLPPLPLTDDDEPVAASADAVEYVATLATDAVRPELTIVAEVVAEPAAERIEQTATSQTDATPFIDAEVPADTFEYVATLATDADRPDATFVATIDANTASESVGPITASPADVTEFVATHVAASSDDDTAVADVNVQGADPELDIIAAAMARIAASRSGRTDSTLVVPSPTAIAPEPAVTEPISDTAGDSTVLIAVPEGNETEYSATVPFALMDPAADNAHEVTFAIAGDPQIVFSVPSGFDVGSPEPLAAEGAHATDAGVEAQTLGEPLIRVTIPLDAETHFTSVAPLTAPQLQPAVAPESEVELEDELPPIASTTGGGWTIPLLCLGLGLLAACIVIPQAETNRRLFYEQTALKANLQSLQRQVTINDGFVKTVMADPELAERLASRQMKSIRKGQKVLQVKQISDKNEMSPFSLVAVTPPAVPPAYRPARGTIADLCNNNRSRLFLMGSALLMTAAGLVLGSPGAKSD